MVVGKTIVAVANHMAGLSIVASAVCGKHSHREERDVMSKTFRDVKLRYMP